MNSMGLELLCDRPLATFAREGKVMARLSPLARKYRVVRHRDHPLRIPPVNLGCVVASLRHTLAWIPPQRSP
jgi:hypothetical protein